MNLGRVQFFFLSGKDRFETVMSLPEVIRLVICGLADNDRSSTRRKQICNCTSNSNHTAQHSSDNIPSSIKDVRSAGTLCARGLIVMSAFNDAEVPNKTQIIFILTADTQIFHNRHRFVLQLLPHFFIYIWRRSKLLTYFLANFVVLVLYNR
jgi:hypothetical protein